MKNFPRVAPALKPSVSPTGQHGELDVYGIISRPKSLFTNASWNILSILWSVGILFLLTPFLINHLGETHYGIYLILSSIGGIMGVMNLGLGEATLRFVAHYHARKDFTGINSVFQATLFVYSITGMGGALTLVAGSPWIVPIFRMAPSDEVLAVGLSRWLALAVATQLISGCFGAVSQALQRYDLVAKATVAESLFRAGGAVVVVLSGFGVRGLVLWSILTTVFRLTLNISIAKRLIPNLQPFALPTRGALREVFGYGIYAFLSQLVGMIWEHADKMIIGIFVGTQAVTALTVPKDLAMKGLMVSGAAGNVLMPRFSSLSDIDQKRRLFIRSTSTLLCLTIVMFAPFAVIVPDFLSLWISPHFAEMSAHISQLVAASSIVRGGFQPYMALFRGMGKPKYILIVTALSSGTILIANISLIPHFGLAGAGYSYCLSTIWGFVAIVFAWRRLLGIVESGKLIRVLLVPILLGFACMAAGFAMRQAWPHEINWVELLTFSVVVTAFTNIVVLGYDFWINRSASILWAVQIRMRYLLSTEGRTM